MSCGLESRLPMAEIRKLWAEMRMLSESLSQSVGTAETYLRGLDVRIAGTRKYFADIRGRLSGIPSGETVIEDDVKALMGQNEKATKEHFIQMKNEAAECYEQVTKERSEWMDETTRLIGRQMDVLSSIDIRAARHQETLRLRARIFKTFRDILNVEGEVRKLQKVLYECEVGKVELEEDFVGLLKIFQDLTLLEEKAKSTSVGEVVSPKDDSTVNPSPTTPDVTDSLL